MKDDILQNPYPSLRYFSSLREWDKDFFVIYQPFSLLMLLG
ncbi:hypothetical protein J2S11_002316 [Bacillus horti]|uniref:Uncharacterized protein n=1 Tax=Caldalkalibacillus horti TaxID=77523 RepID=A0ABT9W015_9BACI|nr:hypothetical protein [Bacillus horti]